MDVARGFADDMLEQLVAQVRRLIQSIGSGDPRKDNQLPRPNESLQADRVVLEVPAKPDSVLRFGQAIPSERSDPGPAQRTDEGAQVHVGGQVRLEDRHAGILGSQCARAQYAERTGRRAIAEVRPFDEFIFGKAMKSPRKLFGMNAETPPEALKGHMGRRLLGKELKDFAVVLPKVVDGLAGGRIHGRRNHGAGSEHGGPA